MSLIKLYDYSVDLCSSYSEAIIIRVFQSFDLNLGHTQMATPDTVDSYATIFLNVYLLTIYNLYFQNLNGCIEDIIWCQMTWLYPKYVILTANGLNLPKDAICLEKPEFKVIVMHHCTHHTK